MLSWLLPLLMAGGGALAGGMSSKGQGGSFLGGSKGGFDQVGKLTEDQQQLMSQLMPQLMQGQQGGMDLINQLLSGDDDAFAKFEDPFKRQFEQETMPGIAERFAGMGSGGSQSSSGMQQTMGQAGSELSENLASLRGGLQQNALGSLQGMMGLGMGNQFESVYKQPTSGFWGGLGSGMGSGAGNLMGMQALKGLGVG